MQDTLLNKKANEIQSFADGEDMKKFHDALKTVLAKPQARMQFLPSSLVLLRLNVPANNCSVMSGRSHRS